MHLYVYTGTCVSLCLYNIQRFVHCVVTPLCEQDWAMSPPPCQKKCTCVMRVCLAAWMTCARKHTILLVHTFCCEQCGHSAYLTSKVRTQHTYWSIMPTTYLIHCLTCSSRGVLTGGPRAPSTSAVTTPRAPVIWHPPCSPVHDPWCLGGRTRTWDPEPHDISSLCASCPSC